MRGDGLLPPVQNIDRVLALDIDGRALTRCAAEPVAFQNMGNGQLMRERSTFPLPPSPENRFMALSGKRSLTPYSISGAGLSSHSRIGARRELRDIRFRGRFRAVWRDRRPHRTSPDVLIQRWLGTAFGRQLLPQVQIGHNRKLAATGASLDRASSARRWPSVVMIFEDNEMIAGQCCTHSGAQVAQDGGGEQPGR